ncbi:hypothetical protein [Micromonospora sp. NPDC126480]|uniref:hypothetical protein n=1 Tax=Micromonospora sp. NPDC126480 TaxID=3155312 RepID=UPI00332F34E8
MRAPRNWSLWTYSAGIETVSLIRPGLRQVILRVAAAFRRRCPDSEIQAREVQFDEALAKLRADEIQVLLIILPIEEPDLVTGPMLFTEPRLPRACSRALDHDEKGSTNSASPDPRASSIQQSLKSLAGPEIVGFRTRISRWRTTPVDCEAGMCGAQSRQNSLPSMSCSV